MNKRLKQVRTCKKCKKVFNSQGRGYTLSNNCEYYCDYAWDVEQELHRMFSDVRIRGEWFDFKKRGGLERIRCEIWRLLDYTYGLEYEDLRIFTAQYGSDNIWHQTKAL